MKKIIIPNGSMAEEAQYKEQVIPDYQDNPFIEALPNLLSPHKVVEKLAFYPQYHQNERKLDSHYRIYMVDRLFQVFQPLPMNIELERKISRTLRQGYVFRNPFESKLAQGFCRDYYGTNPVNLKDDDGFYPSSFGFTLIGISGLGKTSSLKRILNMYPQIIVHSEYRGIPFSAYQVVWVKLECPHDGSIKGLLYEFFSEIDRLLGTNYYQKMMKTRATADAMMTVMNQVVRNCSLGLLVIDEIQHLSMAKSGGSEKMLNFFVNLVNNVGVPVILVGTPKAVKVLQGDFRQARRGSGLGGDMVCDRIQKDEVWDLLVSSIWHYQWTRKETPFTPEISSILYEETQGIPDLLKKVYAIAQAYAISSGKEEITPYIIRKVAKENLKLVQPMLTALKTGNIREIAKYEDICMAGIDFNDFLTRTKESINLDLRAKEIKKKQNKMKQENLMEEKKEAVSKLVDLGMDAKKAQKIIDTMPSQNQDVSVDGIVEDATAVVRNDGIKEDMEKKRARKVKGRKEKQSTANPLDIRTVVEQGKKDNKSAYESLKEAEYIISFEDDIFFYGGGMVNFFPTPYPDELLYSTLARYCIRSGNIREIHNFEDLFGTRNCIAVMELPTQLDALIENMPVNTKYTAEYFIYKHTLFPFLAAFIPQERAKKIIQTMRNGEGAVSYIRIGLISNSIILNKYFRFCPECFKEDVERFGEPYWHRSHQITGVFVCSKHKMPLYNSTELIRAGNRQRYIGASHGNCIVEKEISYSNDLMKKMLWMAEDAEILLNNQFGFKEPEWFRSQFRVKLVEKGYARMNNYIHQKKLKQDFVDFYGHEYLQLVQSPVLNNSGGWLSDMVRKNNRTTYAVRYLLLARFLGISVTDLFNTKLGFNDEDENNIDAYQELWDQRLIELAQSGLSIREIADVLKASTKTIRKSIDRLGIEPFWKFNGGGKYLHKKYTDSEEFKIKREEFRRKWLQLHVQYANISSNQIRRKNDGLYTWLKRYDSKWLEQNYRRIKTATNTVDWAKRDAELLPQVKEVVKEMKEGKPERITWTTIGSKLGISGWLSKKKEKLPLVKAYIDSEVESLEEFQIRKIKWAIEELERQGKEMTLWNLAETAGVKPRYMKVISKEIQELLVKKSYH